jgi:hypothetical protein
MSGASVVVVVVVVPSVVVVVVVVVVVMVVVVVVVVGEKVMVMGAVVEVAPARVVVTFRSPSQSTAIPHTEHSCSNQSLLKSRENWG